MEPKELRKAQKTEQKIQLVKGEFTRSEASFVVNALIDEKINFHKIQRLQIWEGDHGRETDQLDGRIAELEEEKRIAKAFIKEASNLGHTFKINGTLEISINS
jgi:hypothetical protein